MTSKINLAGKPFSNRALPWAVTILVIFISLVAFVFIVRATRQTNDQAHAVQSDINSFNQQEQVLRNQALEVRKSLTAEQTQTLDSAHGLVDRKRFSWSRLLADLESALPGNVRVTRISVRDVATRGERTVAELDLTVVSNTPSTITQMIGEMDRAGIFQAQIRSQNLQKGRGESGTEYELDVLYQPRAGTVANDDKAAVLASADGLDRASNGGQR